MRTLEGRRASTAVIQARFDHGIVAEIDLHQAQVEQATAEAAVPFYERLRAQVENALSALIGRNPGPIVRGAELVDLRLPLEIPAGLPSELLERRPDVREAAETLHAQLALIGVAEALRWPSLSLTGSTGLASSELSDLFDSGSGFGFLSADVFGTIFDFGRNKQRVAVERARAEQALAAYDKTVRNAFREVEDALIGVDRLRVEYSVLVGRVESARAAVRLARARYDGGVTSYLEVLDIERTLFQAELDASATLREQLAAVVSLYAALGGGWTPPETAESEPEPAPAK
jgi:multidrug efflux system outer membrane protein